MNYSALLALKKKPHPSLGVAKFGWGVVHSEEGELYSEFGIDEDANLYRFEVEFENGYSCTININSGQCSCYIDYIVYDPNGHECSCIVGDDTLSNGDCIKFDINDVQYVIKIEEI